MRWGRSLVVVVSWAVALGTTGCAGGEDAGDGGDGPAVDRYDATGDVPGAGAIEASEVGFVGLTAFDNTRRDALVVSHDGGRTWRAADLPDEPAEQALVRSEHGLLADGDRLLLPEFDDDEQLVGSTTLG